MSAPAGMRRLRATRRPSAAEAEPGDWIEVAGTGGAGPRRGVVLEVLGQGPHLHLHVRWDEKHESHFYPGREGGAIVHPGPAR